MSRAHGLNAAALLLAFSLSTLGTLRTTRPTPEGTNDELRSAQGNEGVAPHLDPDGTAVRCAKYERIVSLNPVADHLLLRLVEPHRLIGISEGTHADHPERWRFGQVSTMARDDSIEAVLIHEPDLIVTSPYVHADKVARWRAAGVTCFNPGEMRGLASTRGSIQGLGRLLLETERAAELTRALARDVAALESSAVEVEGAALYLSIYGDSFFGGTAGTSYGDVLRLAGLRDVAAEAGFTDWPQYTAEQLLVLDPPYIVTRSGMQDALRSHPALARLRAVQTEGAILPTHPAYDGDAGLGVIHAAAALQRALRPLSRSSR